MSQKGFTLIEVLVAVTVGGMLMTGVMLTIQQVAWGTGRTNSQVVALTDINFAALRIKKDLMMTQNTDLTDNFSQSDSVLLGWTDYTVLASENETSSHSSSYTRSDTGELMRTYDGTPSIVGRHITYLSFTRDDRVVNVVITATGSGVSPRSETLTFGVYTRTEGIQ